MASIDSNHSKTLWKRFEFALFLLLLFIIALRATHTESVEKTMSIAISLFSSPAWSMIISSTLILATIAWFIFSFASKKISYKRSGIELGAAIFILAAVVSVSYASNKRAAINETVTIVSVLSVAIILTQLLTSQRRIKLLLMVIVGVAAVNCYQSSEQFFISNQMMIDQYEESPEIQLGQMSIEPGSFQHALYEHRLYSKDVRGFFTTGNSAAAFALLALAAAVALFISEIRNPNKDDAHYRNVVIYAAFIGVVIASLILTHSKGGIAGTILAMLLFAAYLMLRKLPLAITKTLVVALILLAIAAVAAIVAYGIKHDGLPGGNSMLVRWQYWKSAASVYADNKLAGVGGGNFGSAFTQYKTPAAPETVKDPHCFPLSILVQYGLLGLIGFLAAIAVPILKTIFGNNQTPVEIKPASDNKLEFKCGAIIGIFVTIGLLIFRPIIMADYVSRNFGEKMFVLFYLYLPPIIMFGVSFLFMWISARHRPKSEKLFGKTETAFIICCLVGVISHNMIDFAIFEPGILTAFFAMIACVAAIRTNAQTQTTPPAQLSKPAAIAGVAVCVIIATVFLRLALIPTLQADRLTQRAMLNYDYTHVLLAEAGNADALSPDPANTSGRLYLQQFMQSTGEDILLLENSAKILEFAALRDPKNFKHYEKLSEAYGLWANILASSDASDAKQKLQKAYDNNKLALELYPGSGKLWYKLAEICEKLKLENEAIDAYANAAKIEQAYQEQFKVMYPGRSMVSRLGEYKYQQAIEKSTQIGK
jgi:hypothetical protein